MGADTAGQWAARRMVIRSLIAQLLTAIGEDPTREGLVETPDRVARMWQEFLTPDEKSLTVFAEETGTDDLVAVKGMDMWSMCEHHLMPFSVTVSIGYLPRGKVLGLSKFARIARAHAGRLQLQERLARGIADDIARVTGTEDVAVVVRGEHTCMSMRGVKTPAVAHTSVMLGKFRDTPALRAEFLALVG